MLEYHIHTSFTHRSEIFQLFISISLMHTWAGKKEPPHIRITYCHEEAYRSHLELAMPRSIFDDGFDEGGNGCVRWLVHKAKQLSHLFLELIVGDVEPCAGQPRNE
jgi:hypothetical protein